MNVNQWLDRLEKEVFFSKRRWRWCFLVIFFSLNLFVLGPFWVYVIATITSTNEVEKYFSHLRNTELRKESLQEEKEGQ